MRLSQDNYCKLKMIWDDFWRSYFNQFDSSKKALLILKQKYHEFCVIVCQTLLKQQRLTEQQKKELPQYWMFLGEYFLPLGECPLFCFEEAGFCSHYTLGYPEIALSFYSMEELLTCDEEAIRIFINNYINLKMKIDFEITYTNKRR